MDIHLLLKNYWGYQQFRPLQKEIIESVLDGKDTLALMPTGGGKSICFQIPAMAKEGLCLVISPLIALMKDQVENLRKKGITAFAIYSGMSRKEVLHVLKVAGNSNCRFLYVSPERLETSIFKEYLPGLPINLIAVDEAHCISQWGYDFRPSYLRIASLRIELPHVPVLALTASATKEVQQDICDKLLFKKNYQSFQLPFERLNISYSVFHHVSKNNKLEQVLKNVSGSSIVYCKTRRHTQQIAQLIQTFSINADFYHAGLTTDQRAQKQENWIHNKTRVMVSTNAFGMGIDKPDVRTIVHYDLPDCVENYYQEAGRAGRDGKKSYCVLMYDDADVEVLKRLTDIRFPALETIQQVYQSVSNYLQVPIQSGEGEYFDFDLNDFSKKFKVDILTVMYALKTLEQEEYLSFNEQVFLSGRLMFTTTRNELNELEKNNSLLSEICKGLLRSYEGIFDNFIPINENQLAAFVKQASETVKQSLLRLNQLGIVAYEPQKDAPQLRFLQPRIKAEDVKINTAQYVFRRKQYEKRLNALIDYLTTQDCRSKFIANYFNDFSHKNCGVCDNCIEQNKLSLSIEEFNDISQKMLQVLRREAIHVKVLQAHFKSIAMRKILKVIQFLLDEKKLQMNSDGMLICKQ